MDRERQTALRARADEAIRAALAAADARAPSLGLVLADAMEAISLVCWDSTLDAGDKLALIDDALLLIPPLRRLARAPQDARPAQIAEVFRRTNDLLRRYAQLVRAERSGS